jgi:hypothetical protein
MTNRFFLFNKLCHKKITDQYVFEWLSLQFGLNKLNDCKVELIGQVQQYMSQRETLNFHLHFDLDFNIFSNPVFTSNRFRMGSKIFHSLDYNRVGSKCCNYIISYKVNNLTHYGMIKYFLKTSNQTFVVLKELKIFSNLYENIGARTNVELTNLRNQGAFNCFFCYCQEINNSIIINYKQIITKCIATKLDNSNYCISEFIDLPDHS